MKWLYEDFDSGITQDQWNTLVSDKTIFTDDCLEAFRRMLDFGESATCTQLAYEYGNNAQHYSGIMTKLGERILKKTNCKEPPAIKDRENSFWPIIFVGKDVDPSLVSIEGKFSWKIRDEIKEALKKIDLSKYTLRENEILANEWVFSCNPKKYDVISAFNERPTVKWKQYESKVKVGDIVYIYISKKDSKIPAGLKYKCEVIATGLNSDPEDLKYYAKADDKHADALRMELKLLETFESVKYSYDNLTTKGFIAPQGYCHLKPEVKAFLETGKIVITENELRDAYKNDLQKKHPDWARQTLATHMSDSFFIRNNNLVPNFWELFESDSNLTTAESILKKYFESINSPRVDERTAGYFNEIKNLKAFIDRHYGGIENLSIADESNVIKEKLLQIKEWYKEFLKENQEVAFDNEKYKWEELTQCQNLSGIEIAKYLVKDKTNLLENLSRVVLGELCESNPEDISQILDKLFDNKEDLHKRVNNFEADIDRLKSASRIPDDERSASVLLSCHSPDKYPIFKATFYEGLCKYIGIKVCAKGDKYIHYVEIMKVFTELIKQDKAFVDKMNELTKGYINPLNLIAQNILYVRFESSGVNGEEIMETIAKYEKYTNLLESSKNLVLTGAPGTGKSYMAKKIAEEMQAEYEFVQFHPSYDYTDFVEGLRPTAPDQNGNIGFKKVNGVFKDFCIRALQNLIESNKTEEQLAKDKSIKDSAAEFLNTALTTENNKFTTKTGNEFSIVNLNEETSEVEISIPSNAKTPELTLKLDTIYELLENDICKENVAEIKNFYGRVHNRQEDSYYFSICSEISKKLKKINSPVTKIDEKKFVFIIDEINRGEASKIFGELFYSIDPGYRGRSGKVFTQYANMETTPNIFDSYLGEKQKFGHFFVPENVYIIGTMNDIDRSVESMDFAFRRRFRWEEISATQNIEMLSSLEDPDLQAEAERRMTNLNDAISNTPELSSAYNIGPSYFLKLKETQGDLNERFKALWDGHLESLLKEYLRGRSDMQSRLDILEEAYYKEESVE